MALRGAPDRKPRLTGEARASPRANRGADRLREFIASEAGLLEEAAADEDAVPGALITFREEVARGLASLRKAVAA